MVLITILQRQISQLVLASSRVPAGKNLSTHQTLLASLSHSPTAQSGTDKGQSKDKENTYLPSPSRTKLNLPAPQQQNLARLLMRPHPPRHTHSQLSSRSSRRSLNHTRSQRARRRQRGAALGGGPVGGRRRGRGRLGRQGATAHAAADGAAAG